MEEVKFEIDKNAFEGPFRCHGIAKLMAKKMCIDGNIFTYSAWVCGKCGKEYLDSLQAKRLEAIWAFEKMAKDEVLCMERALNFDGKMFFIRFPKELTKKWKQGNNACIKMIDTKRFLVEVKC